MKDSRRNVPFKVLGIGALVGVAFLVEGLALVLILMAFHRLQKDALGALRQETADMALLVNCSALVRPSTAEEAAIMVARRYEPPGEDFYGARPDLEAGQPASKEIRFIVSRSDRDCAKVRLVPFLDLGWQEGGYERLGD